VELALLGAQSQPRDVVPTRVDEDPLDGDRKLLQGNGREQSLLIGTFGLWQQIELQGAGVLGLAQTGGCTPPVFERDLRGAKQHRVSAPLDHVGGQPDRGVAWVVRAQDLPDASLDVAKKPQRGIARGAQRGPELALCRSESVEDDQHVTGAKVNPELFGGRSLEVMRLIDDERVVLAQGLATCALCALKLQVKVNNGYLAFECKNPHCGGNNISARKLDGELTSRIFDLLELEAEHPIGPLVRIKSRSDPSIIAQAEKQLADAEYDLQLWQDNTDALRTLGQAGHDRAPRSIRQRTPAVPISVSNH